MLEHFYSRLRLLRLRTAPLPSHHDELFHLSSSTFDSWLTRDTLEVWHVPAGMKAASQNYVSAARSVFAMWLSLNSGKLFKAEADFASDCKLS
jgi:hypothetical protein